MKRFLLTALCCVLAAALALSGVGALLRGSMPDYPDAIGLDPNVSEKITGEFLVRQAAAEGDLLIFGSSELKTTEIGSHPANFFADKRCGFQISLVGRGSCQSLVHAMSIAASGDALEGRKVVLITAPQSYVPTGIAPDLFLANFSEQQMLTILQDKSLSDETRRYLAGRVQTLIAQYRDTYGEELQKYTAAGLLSKAVASDHRAAAAVLLPYAALSRRLLDARDLASSRRAMAGFSDSPSLPRPVDWAAEEAAALAQASEMSTNNEFGMQDAYYSTYIGKKLEQQAGKDAEMSYAESPEYEDLRCLLSICRDKDMEVLFVHVPMHGEWFDYTGFDAEHRAAYYGKVRAITEEFDNVTLLDLTAYEYEPYFLCDTMHLGWKGWLEVDRAITEFYP